MSMNGDIIEIKTDSGKLIEFTVDINDWGTNSDDGDKVAECLIDWFSGLEETKQIEIATALMLFDGEPKDTDKEQFINDEIDDVVHSLLPDWASSADGHSVSIYNFSLRYADNN